MNITNNFNSLFKKLICINLLNKKLIGFEIDYKIVKLNNNNKYCNFQWITKIILVSICYQLSNLKKNKTIFIINKLVKIQLLQTGKILTKLMWIYC